MAKYWYKRYESKLRYSRSIDKTTYTSGYTYWPRGTTYLPSTNNPSLEWSMINSTLGVDEDTGFYAVSRWVNKTLSYDDWLDVGYEYLVIESPTAAYSCQANRGYRVSHAWTDSLSARWPSNKYTITSSYVRGEYVDEIIADEDAHPNGGRDESDGYWYERDRLATQFYARVNGRWIETESYARVNGVWRKAELGVLKGKNLFSVDDAGNAQLTGNYSVSSENMHTFFKVNIYHGGFAEA